MGIMTNVIKSGNKQTRKAQTVIADFLLAIIVLLIIVQLSMSGWTRNIDNLRERESRVEIENLALSISDTLARGEGVPGDWSGENATTLGLANEPNVLDTTKVDAFINLDKSVVKKLLGIGGYKFSFILKTGGTVVVEYGEQVGSVEDVVVVRRLVLYNDDPTLMEFRLWSGW